MKRKFRVTSVFLPIGIIFFVVGMVLAVIGGIKCAEHSEFMETAETTWAEVTDIEQEVYYRKSRRKTRHRAWVEYEVDGCIYNRKLDNFNSTTMYKFL